MKKGTRLMQASLVVVAMLPLTCGVAAAQTLKGILGQQARTLVQQAQGATSGVGTVDLTHPKTILGRIKGNAQGAVNQVEGQAEQTGLGDAQGLLGAAQGTIAQLQAQLPQN
jgi:hypothetical protein